MMKKNFWYRCANKLHAAFMAYLSIFAGEDRFIRHPKEKGEAVIKEQQRYGNDDGYKK
ncbi:hypothetical protein [Limosilactobacillus difficilis]|uniref:hypothetical protein n=1 Tax=Limosilactobacillus difficilis TaxID=2991838 RepID=UPI0024B92F8D|nr:hypothetical protein [Limosilactobacillus difficilis]